MASRCHDCKKNLSVKANTAMEDSWLPLKKWVSAVNLESSKMTGLSSVKLHRDMGVAQANAWFMFQRIREVLIPCNMLIKGPVEVDEAHFQRKEQKKHGSKKLNAGPGTVGKVVVVGLKDRENGQINAEAIQHTNWDMSQGFTSERTDSYVTPYADYLKWYSGIECSTRRTVKHTVGKYVRGQAHVNWKESFCVVLSHTYHGVYHKISKKHLNRYIGQLAGKHNLWKFESIDQMSLIVLGMSSSR